MKCGVCNNNMVLNLRVGLEYWKCDKCGFSKPSSVSTNIIKPLETKGEIKRSKIKTDFL